MTDSFGFIHEKIDIKVLILFIMRRLPEPVTIDVLTGLVMCDDGIGYFDFTECITQLVETQHLQFEDSKYSLTAKGLHNGEILEKNLPYSVRLEAEDAASRIRAIQNRNAMIKTHREIDDNGTYMVILSLSDGVGDVVSMKLLAANEQQANAMEQGFRKNAENIYHALVELIQG